MCPVSRVRNASFRPFTLLTRTLARSAGVLFAVITFITVSCAGYLSFDAQQEKSVAIAKRIYDQASAEGLVRMLASEKRLRADVAQMQQLSDEPGARDATRQNEAIARLEATAKQFSTEMADAKGVAADYGGADLAAVLSDVERRFSQFHEQRLTMAKAYAAQDLATVDRLRASSTDAAMQDGLKRIGPAIDATKQARAEKTAAENKKIDKLRDEMITISLASCIITALACLIGVMAVRKWVVRPLSSLTRCFTQLAAGDTRDFSHDTSRKDEIGDLARAYDDFRRIVLDSDAARVKAREQEELIESERLRADAEKAAAEQQKIEAMRAMVDQVETETNVAVASLIELMDHMTEIASNMSEAAERLGATSRAVSSASAESLAAMQSASSSTRELSSSIDRVADQIRDARVVSDEAVLATLQAGKSIGALSRVATEINEVTGLIAHITRQTGLLALNAGVEAARAGNEGHGFAIIAREIRSLANQTADATNKIAGLISEVQKSTTSTVGAVDEISKTIDRVSRSSENITNAIKNQVGTTKRIAENVDGTASSVTKVTRQIQDVADEAQGAREMAKNVEDVCSDASASVRTLQMTLVKIVRTSSGVVNRRAHTRYDVDSAGTIEFAGGVVPVEIADLSEGGAKLLGDVDRAARDFHLNIPGIERPLRSRVTLHKGDAVHAKFEISAAEQDQLRSHLKRANVSAARDPTETAA